MPWFGLRHLRNVYGMARYMKEHVPGVLTVAVKRKVRSLGAEPGRGRTRWKGLA
jgi:hypothetical protein